MTATGRNRWRASVEQYLTQYFLAQGDRLPPPGVYDRIVQEVERPLISICLAATRGNQIRAAQLLGLNRNTLRKKIRDLGLEVIRGCAPNRPQRRSARAQRLRARASCRNSSAGTVQLAERSSRHYPIFQLSPVARNCCC